MLGIFTSWVFGDKDIKNAAFNKIGLAALFTAVVGFITWVTDIVIAGMDQITVWLNEITQANWPEISTEGMGDVLGLANHLLPISEAISIYGSLYIFWGIVLIIRWVKSFFPTIAN